MKALVCGVSEKETKKFLRILTRYAKEKGWDIRAEMLLSVRELVFKWEDSFHELDLLLLDADFTTPSGLEAAKRIRALGFNGDLILFAKEPTFAPDGYEVEALGFILKGQNAEEKLRRILLKTGRRVQNKDREVLVFSRGRENRYIAPDDITYFEIRGRLVTVHYGEEGSFDFYAKMKDLERELEDKGFVRTHKSYLVREKNIQRMRAREILLTDGTRLQAGQNYIAAIRKDKPSDR